MAGVYVSYPFCGQKCTYCNFASGVQPRKLELAYEEALVREISAHAWQWRPETVYLGGGTPSRMTADSLAAILRAVPGAPWTEATMEASPGDVTADRARMWRDVGITRVSLGVQSFVDLELRQTGRKHTAETVAEEVERLRSAGIEAINIDLIAGLPHQTLDSWRESLAWIRRLAPPHVSVYLLEVDEDSRLGLEILGQGSRYGAAAVPGESEMADLYELAVEELAFLGIERYEISNFARVGSESRHNLKYWQLEPYAGFGADAHGFDGHERVQNAESATEYVERMRARGSAVVERIGAELEQEKFFVGLRLMRGVQPTAGEWTRWHEPIERFIGAGLLERAGGALRLTRRGVLLSNEVFQEFVSS
ncbi:MAG: radical SAM family heme chaperone HemW [Bryobacteraceae bacterium]